ncbi:MAG: hypothetical protein ABH845_00410, partial [Candidatus Omnitrophota bacterium]
MPFKGNPERILVVSLSNVGDVFLTAPVVRELRRAFPAAALHLVVGKGTKEIFEGDPRLRGIMEYDKKAPLREKWRFVQSLRQKRFDFVVDLRHTLLPLLLGVRFHTPLFARPPRRLLHQMDRHLWQLETLGI